MHNLLCTSFTALFLSLLCLACRQAPAPLPEPSKPIHELQQDFVDLRFGLFTHYGLPTYTTADWSDPDMSPEVMSAPGLDCGQWADAAVSAGMTFGCISVKHHNGFCLWDSQTTDYHVTGSPLGRDVLKEYCEAFAQRGLKVMFHFSILDTHHRLRPNMISKEKVQLVKDQLTELLTGYGPVSAIIFDGYEAPWGRISYEDVSFQELYRLIKSLQPDCLVLDMNSDKYPREALFYTDIKFYEQGAGQKVDASENRLPSVACLPLQRTWFWKEDMPVADNLRSAEEIVYENLIPYGKAHCSFILNAAPNRDGRIDDNALARLKEIGDLWKAEDHTPIPLPASEAPVVGRNLAKFRPSESSWSDDTQIMDLANDDDFLSAWRSAPGVKTPFWEVMLDGEQTFDTIVVTEGEAGVLQEYRLSCFAHGKWNTLFEGEAPTKERVKIHRFKPVSANKVRITITSATRKAPSIAELGVYQPL